MAKPGSDEYEQAMQSFARLLAKLVVREWREELRKVDATAPAVPVKHDWPHKFRSKAACEYLMAMHDMHMTPSSLAQHRTRRTGPESSLILKRVYYTRAALDTWVEKMATQGSGERKVRQR